MPPRKVSKSRFGRFAKMGRLGARLLPLKIQRLRQAVSAPKERRPEVLAKMLDKHDGIAADAFATLGELKGVALKIGQMVSFMDGALPAEYRDVYQRALQQLQADAPALPYATIAPLLEEELGAPAHECFERFDQEPFAAASIGQVHRATLPGGVEVAVKVQYPGIDKAMAADLKNASLMQGLMTPFLAGMGAGRGTREYMKDIMAEIRTKLMQELDYEREAMMQTRFRELLADDPEVVIPEVFPGYSGRRVLTTRFIEGVSLQSVCDTASQQERDRYGVILTRTMLRCMHSFRLFNADPHPGNYLFTPDGRVCLLDFGCVKEIPDAMADAIEAYLKVAIEATRTGDERLWARFDELICEALHLDPSDEVVFGLYREFLLFVMRPALTEGVFEFTSDYTGESIDRVLDGIRQSMFEGRRLPKIPELPPVPPDYTFINRLQWGFYSVLTMLGARVPWQALIPFVDEPTA